MNNQFSQRVSDIIVYSKEEANRLRSRYIGPEHLLLGILRDGEGKAIEILSKLNTNLAAIKQQIEAQLKAEADDMLLPDAEVPLSNDAAKILKMCILEARGMKSNIADTEHVLLAILREKNNMAASVLEANDINYVKVLEQATLQPDINSGMGFTEDDDDDEEMSSPRSGRGGSDERQQAQTASNRHFGERVCMEHQLSFQYGFNQRHRPLRETCLSTPTPGRHRANGGGLAGTSENRVASV